MLKGVMEDESYTWNDIGNDVEHGGANGEGRYSEEEMLEFAQAARAEGVEEGIKIGVVRGNGRGNNGHLHLPEPAVMAEFCNDRQSQLNDWERKFIADMVLNTRGSGRLSPFLTRWNRGLKPRQLGSLAKIYISLGGAV